MITGHFPIYIYRYTVHMFISILYNAFRERQRDLDRVRVYRTHKPYRLIPLEAIKWNENLRVGWLCACSRGDVRVPTARHRQHQFLPLLLHTLAAPMRRASIRNWNNQKVRLTGLIVNWYAAVGDIHPRHLIYAHEYFSIFLKGLIYIIIKPAPDSVHLRKHGSLYSYKRATYILYIYLDAHYFGPFKQFTQNNPTVREKLMPIWHL